MNTPADQARRQLAQTAGRKDAARRTGAVAAMVAGLLLGSLAVMLVFFFQAEDGIRDGIS